ncbi:hypothetical protein FKM82_024283 [Ascaphus truei]
MGLGRWLSPWVSDGRLWQLLEIGNLSFFFFVCLFFFGGGEGGCNYGSGCEGEGEGPLCNCISDQGGERGHPLLLHCFC